jgi:hypothetical protein
MTSTNASDGARNLTARVVGIAMISAIAIIVIANYGVSFRLIVPGDAAHTARNIAQNAGLFRLNIGCDLLYAIDVLIMLTGLYVILKPVNRGLAMLAALGRVVYAVMWGVTAFEMLGALRILTDDSLPSVFADNQLAAMARLHLAGGYDAYYIGLPFWMLASLICAYLWFSSRLVPRALAVYGMASSAWCLGCALAFIMVPDFKSIVGASWYDMPAVLFELALGLWLVVKGLKAAEAQQR